MKSLAYRSAESTGSTFPGSVGLLNVPGTDAPADAWPAGADSEYIAVAGAGILSATAFACDALTTAAPVVGAEAAGVDAADCSAGEAMLAAAVAGVDDMGDASDDDGAGSGVWLCADCVDCDPDKPSSGAGSILVPLRIASKCK